MSEVKIIASKESPSKYDMWIHYINKKLVLQRYVNGKWTTIASEDLSLIDPTDFTQEYQDKLDSIAAGAEVNTINKVLIDSTELPIENKQVVIPWDTKEDKIVRFSIGSDSGHYAVLSGIKNNEPLLISVTTIKYGNISNYGFIFHTGESFPKATGNISAKFGNSRNSIGIAMSTSAGYENVIVSVLPLSDNKFTGTLTDESTYAGSEITNTDSVYDYKYEHVNNKTTTLDSDSTNAQYPSAKAVYDFTKVKSKNFTGSGGSTDIKFAFIPFNTNVLFSFQRESGAFGEGLMYIRTNNTTVERVVCDSSFRTYDTYFYETSGGVVLCYNVDAEPYNITISTIYDSSGECVLGTTKSLGTQIDVDLINMQKSLTAGDNITIVDDVIDTKRVVELTDITIADGQSAIKIITTAGGKQAVAEGSNTTASGDYSHAEGYSTTASGNSSHAEGSGTTANHKSQHVVGEYNIADPSLNSASTRGTYIEIVGNGADENTRSNARTLDWQGNEVLAGKITANGVINGSLFFGLPITTTTLSGNATWNIDDLKNMMKVVLSSSTNGITLPNGGENPFRFQLIVAQDSTGSRALTISGVSGVNVYNPSEFDFSGGGANQICVCTIIWDGTEYIYECTNYVGGE